MISSLWKVVDIAGGKRVIVVVLVLVVLAVVESFAYVVLSQ